MTDKALLYPAPSLKAGQPRKDYCDLGLTFKNPSVTHPDPLNLAPQLSETSHDQSATNPSNQRLTLCQRRHSSGAHARTRPNGYLCPLSTIARP